ncbi:MAG: MBL fold metallo-hydrolase [Terriglobia bacterium]|jgi:ribonuclease Z
MTYQRQRYLILLLIISCIIPVWSTCPRALQAADFKVTLLGTGSPDLLMNRFGPGTLIEAGNQKLVFDAGRGGALRIQQLGIPWNDVTTLFLTHLHSDHIVGLPDLFLTGWLLGRQVPLRVWGPAGTKAMMGHLIEAFQFDIRMRQQDDLRPAQGAIAKDIAPGVVYENAGVKVTAFEVDHGPVRPAFGYRIDYGGRSVVLSGDTRFSENLIRFAQGADVLVHEVCLADPKVLAGSEHERHVMAHHISPQQAGEVFARVKPRLAVYSHVVILGNGTDDEILRLTRQTYSGPLEMGADLMSIEVGKEIKVRRHSK